MSWLALFALGLLCGASGADLPQTSAAVAPMRDHPPEVTPPALMLLEEPVVDTLSPNQVVWYVRVPGVRKVELHLQLQRGWLDAGDVSVPLFEAAMDMADMATHAHDAEALEVMSDIHEISLSTWMSRHAGHARLSVPVETLAEGLALLSEVMREPSFPRRGVGQQIAHEVEWLRRQGPTSLRDVASAALHYAWFPSSHPYGRRPDLAAMGSVQSRHLRRQHAAWRTSAPVSLVVVGDVPWSQLKPRLMSALAGIGGPGAGTQPLPLQAPERSSMVAVDMPGQHQAAIRLRYGAPRRGADDRHAFEVLSWSLGGHFLSRLNANLREDKGLTYGASATWRAEPTYGTLTVSVDVRAEDVALAMAEIGGELTRLIEHGVTDDEVQMASRAAASAWNRTRETAATTIARYRELQTYGESVHSAVDDVRALGDVTSEATRRVAQRWLEDAPFAAVLVGDRAALEPQLQALGWTVRWVTPQDAMLGRL